MTKRRSQMKPGEMFSVAPFEAWGFVLPNDVLVVVDAKTEVGFWHGGLYRVGCVAPGYDFEVIS